MNLWSPNSGNVSEVLIAPNDSLQSVRSSSHPIPASREEFSWGLKIEEQRNQPLFNNLLNRIAFDELQARRQEWPKGVWPPWRKNGSITDLSSTFWLLYQKFTPWSLWLHICFTIPAIPAAIYVLIFSTVYQPAGEFFTMASTQTPQRQPSI